MTTSNKRIESEIEVRTYIAKLKHAIDNGAKIIFQEERLVDAQRDIKYTNKYTIAALFPDENPINALKRELKKISVENYICSVKDIRFPNRSEMRVFGKTYNSDKDVYIKLRVELIDLNGVGEHSTFVMSFHFAQTAFDNTIFPYRKN